MSECVCARASEHVEGKEVEGGVSCALSLFFMAILNTELFCKPLHYCYISINLPLPMCIPVVHGTLW